MLHSVAQGWRPERIPGQIHASFTSVGAALGPGEPIRSAESTGVQASGVVRGRKGPRSGFGLGQTALVLRILDSTEDESTQQPRAWTTFVPLTSSRPGCVRAAPSVLKTTSPSLDRWLAVMRTAEQATEQTSCRTGLGLSPWPSEIVQLLSEVGCVQAHTLLGLLRLDQLERNPPTTVKMQT